MFLEEAPKALYCLLTVLLTFVFLKIGTSRGSGTGVAMRKTVKVSNISGWDRMGKVPWEVKGCVLMCVHVFLYEFLCTCVSMCTCTCVCVCF